MKKNSKKQEDAEKQEKCCKTVLSYYGKLAESFDISYQLIGCYCNDRSEYESKIAFLADSLEISGIFVGTLKINLPLNFRANLFHINRRMGSLPDKAYLKENIHNTDISWLKSSEEMMHKDKVGYKTLLETDFVQYSFTEGHPGLTDEEKARFRSAVIGDECYRPIMLPIGSLEPKDEEKKKESKDEIFGKKEETGKPSYEEKGKGSKDEKYGQKEQAEEKPQGIAVTSV